MAQRNRTGEDTSPACCEVAWLRRRQSLENTPMNRVDARAGEGDGCQLCACGGEVLALLDTQNRLLCDILGAVNALSAAQLATAKKPL